MYLENNKKKKKIQIMAQTFDIQIKIPVFCLTMKYTVGKPFSDIYDVKTVYFSTVTLR